MKRILFAIGLLTVASVLSADGNNPEYVGYGDDANVGVVTKRARAQFGSPSKVYSGDALGVFQSYGYNGSAFAGPKGSIEIQANQDWSTTANGTKILFKTTPDGSTTQATVFTIDDNGNVTLTGSLTAVGLNVDSPTTYEVGTATTITPTSSFGVLDSTGGAIVWAGSPSISTTGFSNGTLFTLLSTQTANMTLTDSSTLQLSTTSTSSDRVFSNPGDNIVLRFYGSAWYEVSFSTGHE